MCDIYHRQNKSPREVVLKIFLVFRLVLVNAWHFSRKCYKHSTFFKILSRWMVKHYSYVTNTFIAVKSVQCSSHLFHFVTSSLLRGVDKRSLIMANMIRISWIDFAQSFANSTFFRHQTHLLCEHKINILIVRLMNMKLTQ